MSKHTPNDSVMPPRPMPAPAPAAAAAPAVCQATHSPSAAAGDEPSVMEKEKPAAKPPPATPVPSQACEPAHHSSPTWSCAAGVSAPLDAAEPTAVQPAPSGSARCARTRDSAHRAAANHHTRSQPRAMLQRRGWRARGGKQVWHAPMTPPRVEGSGQNTRANAQKIYHGWRCWGGERSMCA